MFVRFGLLMDLKFKWLLIGVLGLYLTVVSVMAVEGHASGGVGLEADNVVSKKSEAGRIDQSAGFHEVAVMNGQVVIDGVKVPRGVEKFRSPRSGKTYLIAWGKDGGVSVAEE